MITAMVTFISHRLKATHNREQRQDSDHSDDNHVLEQQNRKARLPRRFAHHATVLHDLEGDSCRG